MLSLSLSLSLSIHIYLYTTCIHILQYPIYINIYTYYIYPSIIGSRVRSNLAYHLDVLQHTRTHAHIHPRQENDLDVLQHTRTHTHTGGHGQTWWATAAPAADTQQPCRMTWSPAMT